MIGQSKYPLVSIVVPVYNVSRYIEHCVASLMSQEYEQIEIILVDDGSTDNSGSIIDGFSKKDSRVKSIHKTNGGVSAARNTGIDAANGEYVMFVDGDDWVEPDYVSYFVNLVIRNKASIGMGTEYFTWKNVENNYKIKEEIISAEKAIEDIYNDKIFVAVWNKIYKKSLLNKVTFSTDIWYGEGMLFNVEFLQLVDTVVIGNKEVYHQTFNPNSAMRNFNLENNYCGIASMWLQRSKWKKSNRRIEEEWNYHRYRFNRTILDGIVRTGQVQENKSVYKDCVRNIRKDIYMPLKREKSIKQKLIWMAYYFCPMTTSKLMAKRFTKIVKKFGGGV
ncbi:glycosyltransferase family 2 protein [Limosilactobacillus fermentum]|uniref:glycosyltransferase family 2 protein n=1 Tax=Limosilactobacillus fermentum TaxID=1613 RepID=UPI001BFFF3D3|nr:glycosyltransferase family 2 protein [Limosilactobacillus fermentum]